MADMNAERAEVVFALPPATVALIESSVGPWVVWREAPKEVGGLPMVGADGGREGDGVYRVRCYYGREP